VNGTKSEVLFISLTAGFCAAGVSLSAGMLETLILFVGSFGLVTIGLLIQGVLFIGLGYMVVYMGAITVIFVFAVLVVDSKQVNVPRSQLNSYGGGVLLACALGGFGFPEGGKLGHVPEGNFAPSGKELFALGSLSFGESGNVLLTIGLTLLFVIMGPVMV
jgi:hypothetical protein